MGWRASSAYMRKEKRPPYEGPKYTDGTKEKKKKKELSAKKPLMRSLVLSNKRDFNE